ncbi:unnamed protein product [Pedinophyceae sp. YPF-701]|nr:unnamed protein product [Pedinophyceae sp. YPF-701]
MDDSDGELEVFDAPAPAPLAAQRPGGGSRPRTAGAVTGSLHAKVVDDESSEDEVPLGLPSSGKLAPTIPIGGSSGLGSTPTASEGSGHGHAGRSGPRGSRSPSPTSSSGFRRSKSSGVNRRNTPQVHDLVYTVRATKTQPDLAVVPEALHTEAFPPSMPAALSRARSSKGSYSRLSSLHSIGEDPIMETMDEPIPFADRKTRRSVSPRMQNRHRSSASGSDRPPSPPPPVVLASLPRGHAPDLGRIDEGITPSLPERRPSPPPSDLLPAALSTRSVASSVEHLGGIREADEEDHQGRKRARKARSGRRRSAPLNAAKPRHGSAPGDPPLPGGRAEVASAGTLPAMPAGDDEFGYVFDGEARKGSHYAPTFRAEAVPAHLLLKPKVDGPLEALEEDEEIEDEEEDVGAAAEPPASPVLRSPSPTEAAGSDAVVARLRRIAAQDNSRQRRQQAGAASAVPAETGFALGARRPVATAAGQASAQMEGQRAAAADIAARSHVPQAPAAPAPQGGRKQLPPIRYGRKVTSRTKDGPEAAPARQASGATVDVKGSDLAAFLSDTAAPQGDEGGVAFDLDIDITMEPEDDARAATRAAVEAQVQAQAQAQAQAAAEEAAQAQAQARAQAQEEAARARAQAQAAALAQAQAASQAASASAVRGAPELTVAEEAAANRAVGAGLVMAPGGLDAAAQARGEDVDVPPRAAAARQASGAQAVAAAQEATTQAVIMDLDGGARAATPAGPPPISYVEARDRAMALDLSRHAGSVVVSSPDDTPRQKGGFFGFLRRMFGGRGPAALQSDLHMSRLQTYCLAKVAMDDGDELHARLLRGVWNKFTHGKAFLRYGAHWEELGFQGTDPATDLRGGGVLALVHLLHLHDINPGLADEVLTLSRGAQEFPLAPVSINVTRWALEAGRRGRLDAAANKLGSFFDAAALYHAGCMFEFIAEWKKSGATIEQSGHVMRRVEELCRDKGSRVVDQALLVRGGKYRLT